MAIEITRQELTAAELRAAAGKVKDSRAARRMLAIALVLDGADRTTAAMTCGMDRQTLRDWVHRYNAEGPAGHADPRLGAARDPAPRRPGYALRMGLSLRRGLPRTRHGRRPHPALRQHRGENLHLAEIALAIAPGAHAVLVLDGAGWHGGKDLVVPLNITPLPLPPCSPELNPVENVWQYLRANKLANTVFEGYDEIPEQCCAAWNRFAHDPAAITSITSRDWAAVNVWGRWCNTNFTSGPTPPWPQRAGGSVGCDLRRGKTARGWRWASAAG